jgi:hypothetical protein
MCLIMKVHQQSIPLGNNQPSGRLVKRGALLAFKALRAMTNQAKEVPGILAQATADVREAWAESSRPNV